jgi:hypothetical protein
MLAAREEGNRQTDALLKIQSLGYGHSGIVADCKSSSRFF